MKIKQSWGIQTVGAGAVILLRGDMEGICKEGAFQWTLARRAEQAKTWRREFSAASMQNCFRKKPGGGVGWRQGE